MRQYLIFILLVLPILVTAAEPDYKEIYGNSYQEAMNFLINNKAQIESRIRKWDNDPSLVIAIVFPELLRYSPLQNRMEITALNVFYVDKGAPFGDYAVGIFQMKPKFVEDLENEVRNYPALVEKYQSLIDYGDLTKPEAIRKERINRLTKLNWQLDYICCFCDVMITKYPVLQTKLNKTDQIKHLSTFYSVGMDKDWSTLRVYMKTPLFSPPKNSKQNIKYNYWSIALHFYRKTIFK